MTFSFRPSSLKRIIAECSGSDVFTAPLRGVIQENNEKKRQVRCHRKKFHFKRGLRSAETGALF